MKLSEKRKTDLLTLKGPAVEFLEKSNGSHKCQQGSTNYNYCWCDKEELVSEDSICFERKHDDNESLNSQHEQNGSGGVLAQQQRQLQGRAVQLVPHPPQQSLSKNISDEILQHLDNYNYIR